MAKDAIVSRELADKFKTEKNSPYLRFVRARPGHHQRPVHAEPAHGDSSPGRAGTKGIHQSRGVAHLERLLNLRIAAGKAARHHLYEEMMLVLSGAAPPVWNNAGADDLR
jgi:hypothetical protein